MQTLTKQRILVCKSLSLGEVVCSFPLATVLKSLAPQCQVYFMSNSALQPLIESHPHIDGTIDVAALEKQPHDQAIAELKKYQFDISLHVHPHIWLAKLAKAAQIPIRVGNLQRAQHWLPCNRLVSVGRRHSDLHESQLDLKFLKSFGLHNIPSCEEIARLHQSLQLPKLTNPITINPNKFSLVIHPLKFSRAEKICWPLSHYAQLINQLPAELYDIYITGNQAEGEKAHAALIKPFPHVIDLTNQLSIPQLTQLLMDVDGVIGASTGPVHLAAALHTNTLGIYATAKTLGPQRWAPLGNKAQTMTYRDNCNDCHSKNSCPCIQSIAVSKVQNIIQKWHQL